MGEMLLSRRILLKFTRNSHDLQQLHRLGGVGGGGYSDKDKPTCTLHGRGYYVNLCTVMQTTCLSARVGGGYGDFTSTNNCSSQSK